MASSSSSSLIAPESSSRSTKYDVFLSFRGKDTRKTFVDHLYSALVDRSIYTYKDDETLPLGDSIRSSLMNAIADSRIALVIFSESYANSSWCLDELTYIMKAREETGLTVLPIFYHVKPSDVRNQEGKYGEAFAKHVSHNNNYRVESWKKALVAAATLAGWEINHNDNEHEAKCIKDIVGTVLDRLFPVEEKLVGMDRLFPVEEKPVGMETRLQDLKSHLKIGSGGVRMVGIFGIGGGGKTTLAISLYHEISDKFDSCCFLNMESSKSNGIKALQEKILSIVSKKEVKVSDVVIGKHMIKRMLRWKNVLVVLDDVNDRGQLEALAGSHDWFGDGSRIVITTRDESLLIAHRVDVVYHVRLLSHEEAIRLLNRHAYNEHNHVENYEMLSQRVVSYSNGLPLALVVLGSFLYDKDNVEWLATLDRLKYNPEMEIVKVLKVSYDGLRPIEKELFLDIACFFRKQDTFYAMEMFEACGFHPRIGIKVLIHKGLITISSYDYGFGKQDIFDMHDLVQEMGQYIVCGEHPNNPEKHSRVWREEDIKRMCDRHPIMENHNIEALQYYAKDYSPHFVELVSNMKNLRLLCVSLIENEDVEGPNFLSNKLRYIYWENYPSSPFPESFNPMMLVILKLYRTLQNELWKGYKFLPSLKELHLYDANHLLKTPDFGELPILQKLTLIQCRSLEEIHPSLGKHSNLVYVSIHKCEKLSMFPTITWMKNLETLKISYCGALREFTDIQANMNRHESKSNEETLDTISNKLSLTSVPASYSQWWNHDIFLSFIGESSCKTFVDHLYSGLIRRGIHTYKPDKTLFHGDLISPSLGKAIQESRIAIIILSKNYVGSSGCLDELAYIMECIDKRERNVMPIFYDVSPSDVRDQNGEFGKAFEKQDLENMSKTVSWRKALVSVCNHPGWSLMHTDIMHEGKYIKDIVDTISHQLFSLVKNIKKDFIGMGTRLESLKSTLEIGSGGVRMVGIGGPGGSGKTTLAFSVYMEISRQFERRCFVENVRDESSKYGLKKLQQKILSTILKREVKVSSDAEGRSMIQSMLCKTQVLIVLDDVDDLNQLEALAGSHGWFGAGSRIIITCRDQHLVSDKVDIIYGVSLLSENEAIQLFSRHAFGKYHLIEDYQKVSRDVVSSIGRLPLALKISGSFLYGRNMNERFSFLAMLKEISNPSCMDMLKISYDGLQHEEKGLFLDIACFFRHQPKDEAVLILDACYYHSRRGIRVLIQNSLINITDGRFDMHDVVQEMAYYIIRGENTNNPKKRSRVWLEEDVLNICTMDAMENYMIQALHAPYHVAPPNLLKVVANMKKLRLLIVRQHVKELVEEPLFLSDGLRWISWENYPATSLPTNFQPSMLFGLILKNGLQKELWTGDKHLLSLKVLSLHGSINLIRTPDFDGLPNLKSLVLSSCSNLEQIHESIGYHGKLVYVNLESCEKLQMLPPIVTMQKLETLILSRCRRLRNFPEIKQTMDGLKYLYMDYSGIEVVPSSIGQFCTNLVSLSLIGCDHLKEIKGNFQLLNQRCLILLNVSDIPSADYYDNQDVEGSSFLSSELPYICGKKYPASPFPESFQPMKNVALGLDNSLQKTQRLESLKIEANMDSLVNLSLRHIGIKALPSSVGKYCTKLSSIKLESCSELKSIEGNFHALKHLQKFELNGSTQLEKLPKDLFDENSFLEELHLRNVWHPSILHLPCLLRRLTLSVCKLEDGEIPPNISELCNLQELDLSWNNFSRLNSSLLQLSQLYVLNLRGCRKLVELPELPTSIVTLNADDCSSLEVVGDIHKDCKWLCQVSIRWGTSVIGGDRLLQSMLQGKAIESHYMSLYLHGLEIAKLSTPPLPSGTSCTLQLPVNWSEDYCGFLMCIVSTDDFYSDPINITLKQEKDVLLGTGSQHGELWNESADDKVTWVGYVSFGLLRNTEWWDSTYNTVSFSVGRGKKDTFISSFYETCSGFGVRLVAGRSFSGSMETTTETSEILRKYASKFKIRHDSKSVLRCRFDEPGTE